MTGLEIGLAVALAAVTVVASIAIVALSVTVPARAARLLAAERERSKATALAAQAALHAAGEQEVATMVVALRALLQEREAQVIAAHLNAIIAEVERLFGPLRALLGWAFTAAHAQYERATTEAPGPTAEAQPGASAEQPKRPTLDAATMGDTLPAQTAAGLGRPHARPLARADTSHAPPVRVRPPLGSAPTMHSMQAPGPPNTRRSPEVQVETRGAGAAPGGGS